MAYISKHNTNSGVKPIGSNLYGTCSTASATATKVVSMSDFNVLVEGVTIHVQFANGNTANNPTLKVGSTSAVAIKRNGSLEGQWEGGSVISFTYDGTNWVQNDSDDSGKTYGLSYNETTDTISLVEGGGSSSVTIVDENTTYTLTRTENALVLTGSNGTTYTVPFYDTNTTYTLSKSGDQITLTGSDGSTSSVSDDDTSYTISASGNTLTLTGSDGSTSSASVGEYPYVSKVTQDPSDPQAIKVTTEYENNVSTDRIITIRGVSDVELSADGTALYVVTENPTDDGTAHTTITKIINFPIASPLENGFMTSTDKLKLDGIEAGAEVNVQSDWNQTDNTADDYIKNKPTIPAVSASADLTSGTKVGTVTVNGTATDFYAPNGGGGGDHEELTQAQYDALSQAEKENGTVYFVTNSTPIIPQLIDIFYPVGSYYETSDTAFDPNTEWGGTWVLDSAGKVTVSQDTSDTSFDVIGETGGAVTSSVPTTTLTDANIAHGHDFTQPTISVNTNGSVGNNPSAFNTNSSGTCSITASGSHSHGIKNGSTSTYFLTNQGGVSRRTQASGSGATNTLYSSSACARESTTDTATHTHTVPNHTHSIPANSHTHSFTNPTYKATNGSVTDLGTPANRTAHGHGSVSTIQPYIVVKRWHRTA